MAYEQVVMYRLYIVGHRMTPSEFERDKPRLVRLELDDLYTALAVAADYLDAGLNAVIEGDDGRRLEADEIRIEIEPSTGEGSALTVRDGRGARNKSLSYRRDMR
jgi:hypothetical protein